MAVLEKLLQRSLIKEILPQDFAAKVDVTSTSIMNNAREFFESIMVTKGRRSNVDANAFWAVATALLPSSLLDNRKGREAARLLCVSYRVIKKAGELRRELSKGSGWIHIDSAQHSDRVDW